MASKSRINGVPSKKKWKEISVVEHLARDRHWTEHLVLKTFCYCRVDVSVLLLCFTGEEKRALLGRIKIILLAPPLWPHHASSQERWHWGSGGGEKRGDNSWSVICAGGAGSSKAVPGRAGWQVLHSWRWEEHAQEQTGQRAHNVLGSGLAEGQSTRKYAAAAQARTVCSEWGVCSSFGWELGTQREECCKHSYVLEQWVWE